MQEVWRKIPNHKNYAVSNLGRVRRDVPGKGTRAGKIRIPYALPAGYLAVDMWHDGKRSRLYVHQAVALAFKGRRPSLRHEVAHYDRRKNNNRESNLRWTLPKGNHADKERHGTHARGSKSVLAILTERKVIKMRLLRKQGRTLHSLAAQFKTCMQNVDLICRRVTWRHV